MGKVLRPYQQKSLEILISSSSGLDASEMGVGKTLTATRRAGFLGTDHAPRILAVAPVNTHDQWIASFASEYPSLAGSPNLRIVGTHRNDEEGWGMMTSHQPGVYVIGWEAMRGLTPASVKVVNDNKKTMSVTGPIPDGWVKASKSGASRGYGDLMRSGKLTVQAVREAMRCGDVPPWHRTGTWDLVIADESHRIQNRHSSNRRVLNLIETHNKLALSGTPAGNKPQGLWSTLNWLWPKRYRSFWDWANLYLIIQEKHINRYDTVQEIVGEKHPGSTFTDIPCVVRWRTAEVADQLPSVIERIVPVEMGPRQRKIYDGFEREAFAWLDDQPVMTDLPITQRIRLRQAALGQIKATRRDADKPDIDFAKTGDQPKISAIKEIISDLPENEPVLIFTHSAKWAVMCADAIDKDFGPARAWTGALSKPQRAALKDQFGTSVRIVVAQVASIAEGVDGLQFVCRCEIWASPSEDGLINEQAKARLHRPGQKQVVQRWVLHSKESIDTDVDASLKNRRAQMRAMYRDKED